MAMAAPRLSLQGLFFVYLSLSSHWHHPLVLNLRIFFEVHLSFFVLFVSGFIIADFSVLFFQLARIVALVARIIKFPRSSPIDAAKIIYPKVPIPML